MLVIFLIVAIATNFKKKYTITKETKTEVEKSVLSTEDSEKLNKQGDSVTTDEKKD